MQPVASALVFEMRFDFRDASADFGQFHTLVRDEIRLNVFLEPRVMHEFETERVTVVRRSVALSPAFVITPMAKPKKAAVFLRPGQTLPFGDPNDFRCERNGAAIRVLEVTFA